MVDLLPVGSRVHVEAVTSTWLDGSQTTDEPYNAIVAGYDMHRTKYRLDREIWDGLYAIGGLTWAFPQHVTLLPTPAETPS